MTGEARPASAHDPPEKRQRVPAGYLPNILVGVAAPNQSADDVFAVTGRL